MIRYRGNQQRDTPLVFFRIAQAYMVAFYRYGFALQVGKHMPAARFAKVVLILRANLPVFRFVGVLVAVSIHKGSIATKVVGIALVQVAVVYQDQIGRVAAEIVFIQIAI